MLPGPVLAADSVTGGAWAAWSGTPIVLTPTDSVHPAVEAFLAADVGAPVLATAGTTNPPETLAAVAGCGGQVQLRSLGPIGSGLLAELDAQDEASC